MFWDSADNLFLAFDYLGPQMKTYVGSSLKFAGRERLMKVDVSDMESQTVSMHSENLNNFGRSVCLAVKATNHDRIYLGGSINNGHAAPGDPIEWSPSVKLLDSGLNVKGTWLLRLGLTFEDYSGPPDNDEAKHTYIDNMKIAETYAGGSYYLFGTTRSTDIANSGSRIFAWKAYLDSQDMI